MKKIFIQFLYSLLFLLIGLIIFFTNITFASKIPPPLLIIAQVSIILICALVYLTLLLNKKEKFRDITFSFLTASVALTGVHLFSINKLGISINTPSGLAFTKLFESAIIIGIIILMFKIAKYKLNSIYISKGKLLLGLIIGIVTFSGMLLLGPPTPVNINIPEFYLKYLPWLLIFIFSNATMEELLYRGIFLKKMKPIIGAAPAIIISSLVFALAHMQITYQSSSEIIGFVSMVFILALLWAFIMYKTESLIASVCFHAGADMVIMISIYKSVGIIA